MLRIYVQPKASRNRFSGIHNDMLKLSITAAPVNGKANKAVIVYLAKFFQIPKKEITIVKGEKSRKKHCKIGLLTKREILEKLREVGV